MDWNQDGFDPDRLRQACAHRALLALKQHPLQSRHAAAAVIQRAHQAEREWQQNPGHIACGPGCSTCCQVNVAILAPEADLLVWQLKQKLSPNELERLRTQLDRLAVRIAGLDDDERIACRIPCPLLDDAGSCSLHPVRPLMCRAITSTSPEACREALALTGLGESRPILMNLRLQQIYQSAFLGLADALEAAGHDARSRPLILFLHQRLSSSGR